MAKILKIIAAVVTLADGVMLVAGLIKPILFSMIWLIVLMIVGLVFVAAVAVFWSWELWIQTPRVKREIEFWNALAANDAPKMAELIARRGVDEAQRRDLKAAVLKALGHSRAEKKELAWMAVTALKVARRDGQKFDGKDLDRWEKAELYFDANA